MLKIEFGSFTVGLHSLLFSLIRCIFTKPSFFFHLILTTISISHQTTAPPPSTAMTSPPPPTSNTPKRQLKTIQVNTSSPRFPPSPTTPTLITASSPSHRRIGIAVDLSDESAYAVKWAVDNYLRPGDSVILLHVRSTSVLYGADWGSSTPTTNTNPSHNPFSKTPSSQQQMEEEYDNFTTTKANHVAQPLVDAHVPMKIHIVKDHDMKERLCLEVERLGLSTVIMGSRGIGAARSSSCKGMLGSVSDYCVQHCACPVVVVRYNQTEDEQPEFHDADEDH